MRNCAYLFFGGINNIFFFMMNISYECSLCKGEIWLCGALCMEIRENVEYMSLNFLNYLNSLNNNLPRR